MLTHYISSMGALQFLSMNCSWVGMRLAARPMTWRTFCSIFVTISSGGIAGTTKTFAGRLPVSRWQHHRPAPTVGLVRAATANDGDRERRTVIAAGR